MSDDNNKNQSSLIDKLLVPIILTLILGGSSPWWVAELKNALKSRENNNEVAIPTIAAEQTKPSTSPKNVPEPVEQKPIPEKTNISLEKLDVSSVEVNNENEYSSQYSVSKIIDSNVKSYWSTKLGLILDVVLDFYFDEPKSLSQIHIYSPEDRRDYTNPVQVKLIFFDNLGKEITREVIMLKSSSDQWQEYKLDEVVHNVSSVKMDMGEPKNNTASYITINEIRLYGYE